MLWKFWNLSERFQNYLVQVSLESYNFTDIEFILKANECFRLKKSNNCVLSGYIFYQIFGENI